MDGEGIEMSDERIDLFIERIEMSDERIDLFIERIETLDERIDLFIERIEMSDEGIYLSVGHFDAFGGHLDPYATRSRLPRRRCMRRIAIAAGVTPGIREAWPRDIGWTRVSFSTISRERPGNAYDISRGTARSSSS